MSFSKKEVLVFAGTRPEIIKMAPVVKALEASSKFRPHFCYTGQHKELAAPFLNFFGLKPDSELQLMSPGQSLGALTSRAAAQMDELFQKNPGRFAAVLVQGDTTTAFTGTLIAFYHKIPVGHVEAGLRTADIMEPFPEELNRRLITRAARWHFAPTLPAAKVLQNELIPVADTLVTGNTGIDALMWAKSQVQDPTTPVLKQLATKAAKLVLVTTHRRENIGKPLEEITKALRQLAERFGDFDFILPVHKNPLVEKTVRSTLEGISNFHLVDPLDYGDLVWVMNRCHLILSDSGGIQEEAPALQKPVLVLRNDTERPEAVEYGTSILVGSDREKIQDLAAAFLSGTRKLQIPADRPLPYGDGHASDRIIKFLEQQIS